MSSGACLLDSRQPIEPVLTLHVSVPARQLLVWHCSSSLVGDPARARKQAWGTRAATVLGRSWPAHEPQLMPERIMHARSQMLSRLSRGTADGTESCWCWCWCRFEEALQGAADADTLEALDWVVSSHIRSRFSNADVTHDQVRVCPSA